MSKTNAIGAMIIVVILCVISMFIGFNLAILLT